MSEPLLFLARRCVPLGILAALSTAPGCVPQSSPFSTSSPDGLSCGQRLAGGTWRFVGFTPNGPLDPQTAAAIQQLQSTLRLGFDGQRAITTGPGLNHVGPYQISNDSPLACTIAAPDDRGTVTTTQVRFLDGNHLQVTDQRSAVPGVATMERVPTGS